MILSYSTWQQYPNQRVMARVAGSVTSVTAIDKTGERNINFTKNGEVVTFAFYPRYEETTIKLEGQDKELVVELESYDDSGISVYGDVALNVESDDWGSTSFFVPVCDVTALDVKLYDKQGKELELASNKNPIYSVDTYSPQNKKYLGYDVLCFTVSVDYPLYRESDNNYEYSSLVNIDHRVVISNLKPLAGADSLTDALYPEELYNKSYYYDRSMS